jgi:hypothetical protein
MEKQLKLYMVMLGCTPAGRITEQHDIFFGIGSSLKEMIPKMKDFWPEAKGRIHIDAWREVAAVDNFSIEIIAKEAVEKANLDHLFFINLGGYKENEFEEYHYKILTVAQSMGLASKKAKKSTFFKHCGFKGAGASHIDDKYGIDVDELYRVTDILDSQLKELYTLKISKSEQTLQEDVLHIGYLKLSKIADTL